MSLHAGRLLCCIVLLSTADATPAVTFPWKSKLTNASSQALAETHELLYAANTTGLTAHAVDNQIWSEKDFELRMESGTLFVEPAIDGMTAGAFFAGQATVSFTPKDPTARAALQMDLGRPTLERVPIKTAYIFTLRPDMPLGNLAASTSGGTGALASSQADTYAADKSAMRQLGFELTATFLNRTSTGGGATYVLFPMEEIRTPRSEEARLLYRFNPMLDQDVSLAVFGHEEIVDFKPFKFKFYELVSYASGAKGARSIDLERSSVKIALGTGAKEALEEASLALRLAPGLKSVLLNLAIEMAVTEVTGPDGSPLPFLQWERLTNDPNFDETILVSVPEAPAGAGAGPFTMNIKATGHLFEPWGSTFYLVDEDDWAPRPAAVNDEAHHELELTIPKKLMGIGIGEKAVEEATGAAKRIVFRTTQPVDQSTLYYGDYTITDSTADEIKVELYQDRTDLREQKNADFVLTEITNALKVFNRMFVPLEIKNLRVASTLSQHGRGFEGLLLLGGGGTAVSSDSAADIFRAHEVAHQWWGNFVRVKHWPQDRWLSEAFAEFAAMEYYRIRFPDPKKVIQVMSEQWVHPLTEGSLKRTSLTGGQEHVVGGTIYPLAAGTNNVYTKGPMVLNMLRYQFIAQHGSDQAFSETLRDFLRTYRYKAASTKDFQITAEKHFGQSLEWFFSQWVEDGGVPILRWSHEIREDAGSWVLDLKARQEQKSYRLLVPVYIHFPGGRMAVRPWIIDGESASRSFKLPAKPEAVTLNDNLEALVILKKLAAS